MNTLLDIKPDDLAVAFTTESAEIGGRPVTRRFLSDLCGSFADAAAYNEALRRGNPLVYEVTSVEPAAGDGQLHYGLGILYQGRIGDEYFLTKGHYHSRREAAEVYVGLKGEGAMLLEDEDTGTSRMVELGAGRVVYVPGHTAHRTVNTGDVPLVYLGIYPADAGHDYGSIATKNFHKVILAGPKGPVMTERSPS